MDENEFRPTLNHYYMMQLALEIYIASIPLPSKKGQKNYREAARRKLKLKDFIIERPKPKKQTKEMSEEHKKNVLNVSKARYMSGPGIVRRRNPDGTFTVIKEVRGDMPRKNKPPRRPQQRKTETQQPVKPERRRKPRNR